VKASPQTSPRIRKAPASGALGVAEWTAWIFILLSAGRVGELIPGLGHIPFAKIIAAIWLCAVLSRGKSRAITSLLSVPIVRVALALLVLAVCSLSFSIFLGASVAFLTGTGAVVAIAFTLLCNTPRSWRFVIGTLRCLVVTATILALAAVAFSGGGRIAAGVSYDTNDLAYVLVTALPLAIAFSMLTRGRARLLYIGISALLILASLLTQSRGGALSLMAIVLCLICMDLRPSTSKNSAGNTLRKRIGRLVVFGMVAVLAWSVLPQTTKERLSTLQDISSDYNAKTNITRGRGAIWKRNWDAVTERPIGFGINSFMAVDGRHGGDWMAPHNSLLQVTVELGFLGLFLYLRIHWLAWRSLGRTAQLAAASTTLDLEKIVFAKALRISLVSNFVAGFFLSMAYSDLLWIVLATIVIFSNVSALPGE